jgi:hypothetical protein
MTTEGIATEAIAMATRKHHGATMSVRNRQLAVGTITIVETEDRQVVMEATNNLLQTIMAATWIN